jgi:hypothetical protein
LSLLRQTCFFAPYHTLLIPPLTLRPSSLARAARAAYPVLAVAAASFALAVVATIADGWPLPRAFDEFSYVLGGETFARGRLTNPSYPMPEALETIHVLQRPTYSSKYLPGHGLFLAAGIALGGGPHLGQWLAFATMGAALYWMLAAWLSRPGAVITTALFMLLIADTDWASGYWGSSAAVAGSALVFGAIRRLDHRPTILIGALTGLGAVLLALTRPLEGLAICLIPAGYLTWWLLASPRRKQRMLHVGLPGVLVLALGAAVLVAHNKAVTGVALRLPYAHYESTAVGAPPFFWQQVNLPQEELRANQEARLQIDLGSYNSMRRSWLSTMWARGSAITLRFYLPHAVFALLLLLVPFTLRDKRLRIVAASAAAVGVAIGTSSFYLPHYLAPAIPPLLLLYSASCGLVARIAWSRQRIGRAMVASLAITLGAFGIVRLFSHSPLEHAMTQPGHWTRQRESIAREIEALPGKHVVFVTYAPSYRSQNEWVQNGADLANGRLLWVHDLGEPANAALRQLESDRTAWLLTVHGGPRNPELLAYAPANPTTLPIQLDASRDHSRHQRSPSLVRRRPD